MGAAVQGLAVAHLVALAGVPGPGGQHREQQRGREASSRSVHVGSSIAPSKAGYERLL
jgi:hypothetical protein